RTIAGELLGAVRAMDPSVRELRGASRTDAGVHAHGQVAAFDAERDIAPKGWVSGLAAHLPAEIAVRRAARVPEGSDPRRQGQGKRYRYLVLRDVLRDPFWEARAWRVPFPLDLALMQREADTLLGAHDFAAFRTSTDPRSDTTRTIRVASVAPHDDPRL